MPLLCACISDSECSGGCAINQAGDKFTAGLGCCVGETIGPKSLVVT